jgi:hypothetical protein
MISPWLTGFLFMAPQELVAIRVQRAETGAGAPIEHALILVENGKITEIGEDLPVERGIRVLEHEDWVATPGLINAHTRIGLERSSTRGFDPAVTPKSEIDPRNDVWKELLELGVTTLGIFPDGQGIPGQAVIIRPRGETVTEMLVKEPAYLKIYLQATASSKKTLREAFQKVDEYEEKVAKEKEKWDKEQEKKKKSSKSSSKEDKKDEKKEEAKDEKKNGALPQDEEKKEEKKDDKAGDAFVPPVPDERVKPFLDLRKQSLTAMISLRKAADYLHLLDVIQKEKELDWFLQIPLYDDCDFYEIAKQVGEAKKLVLTVPELTLQQNSLRDRNIPDELLRAGARVALMPRTDSLNGYRDWLPDVGRLVAQGLAREAALAAVTLEQARALGIEETTGSLEKGKEADIVFWSGDPLEPSSRVMAVMLDGKFVHGDVQ